MRSGGFTLLEMMVVIGIVGLLLGIGIPALNYFKSNNTMRSTADTLLSDIRIAHEQARQNADGTVFVGPVPNTVTTTNNAVDVEVFTVANGKASQLLQQTTIGQQFAPGWQNMPSAAQLIASGASIGALVEFTGPGGQHVLAFQPNGLPVLPAGSGSGTGSVGLSGSGLQLQNTGMTLEILVSTLGDVSLVQKGATGLTATQAAIMATKPTPF